MKHQNLRTSLAYSSIAVVLTIVACSSNPSAEPPPNRACIVQTRVIPGLEKCLGTLDVTYWYRNAPHPSLRSGVETQFRQILNAFVQQYAEPQETETSCYAAALVSGFAAHQVRYRQDQFRAAISNECFGNGALPLTYSQILFAATRVHLSDGGVWFVDLPGQPWTRYINALSQGGMAQIASPHDTSGSVYQKLEVCQSHDGSFRSWASRYLRLDLAAMIRKALGIEVTVQTEQPKRYYHMGLEVSEDIYNLLQVNLYRGVEWQSSNQPKGVLGGIYPVRHPGHLVYEVANRVPVLAGLSGENYGHVVLVSGISFHVPETFDSSAPKHVPGTDTYVDWVEVVDPSNLGASPYKISGDKFFESAQFLFGIYHPR